MTSDAKVGLLLGLIFIFIIAFVINGLPSFSKDKNNNELTTNMVSFKNDPPGIAAKERKVRREVINQIEPVRNKTVDKIQVSQTDNQDIRFTTQLPKSGPVVKEAVRSIEIKPTPPKIYVVVEGDNLAVIAKKLYGPEKGGKKVNITRIFEANRKFLKSPDEIYIGQRLIIPALSVSMSDKNKVESIFPPTKFTKVESIRRKRLPVNNQQVGQNEQYIVREGDNLWLIAAERFGDSSRYYEIARLNAGILDNEDNLYVGMRLKLPPR